MLEALRCRLGEKVLRDSLVSGSTEVPGRATSTVCVFIRYHGFGY